MTISRPDSQRENPRQRQQAQETLRAIFHEAYADTVDRHSRDWERMVAFTFDNSTMPYSNTSSELFFLISGSKRPDAGPHNRVSLCVMQVINEMKKNRAGKRE